MVNVPIEILKSSTTMIQSISREVYEFRWLSPLIPLVITPMGSRGCVIDADGRSAAVCVGSVSSHPLSERSELGGESD